VHTTQSENKNILLHKTRQIETKDMTVCEYQQSLQCVEQWLQFIARRCFSAVYLNQDASIITVSS